MPARSDSPDGPAKGGAVPRVAVLADGPLGHLAARTPPWPGRVVPVAGCAVHVRTTAGAPGAERALYVHGLGGSATNWTDLAGLLAPRLAGVALDLPGFGRSGPPPDNDYSIRAHTRTVSAYLEQEEGGPVHLFGNSMGGAIAASIAAARPDLVRTLTLVSPAVPDLRPRARRQDPVLPLMMLPRVGPAVLRRFEQVTPEARVRAMLKMCWADPSAVPPDRLREAVAELRYRSELGWSSDALVRSLRGLVASYLAPPGRGPWAQLARIAVPTLVIWGGRDRLVSASRAPRTARTIPDARLLIVPDVGHVAQMERPDVVARAVLGLLDEVAGAAATT